MARGPDYALRRLRLRHLELLVRLDEAGTLRGAAQRLSLTQPAVSKMLVEIEHAFGTALFERSRQGMRANDFGRAATRHARVVLGTLSRAGDEIEAMRAGAAAVLHVGTPSATATVPAAVVALQREWPRTVVRLHEDRAQALVRRLLDGDLDAVVGTVTPEALAGGDARRLHSEALVDDRLCVLAGERHALARRRRLGWPELVEARWATAPSDTLVGQAYLRAFVDQGLAAPVPVIETQSPATLGAVLRLDDELLGAVRLEHARDELGRGGLRLLPVAPAVALPPLSLLTRAGEPPPPALQQLAQALRAVAAGRRPPAALPVSDVRPARRRTAAPARPPT